MFSNFGSAHDRSYDVGGGQRERGPGGYGGRGGGVLLTKNGRGQKI